MTILKHTVAVFVLLTTTLLVQTQQVCGQSSAPTPLAEIPFELNGSHILIKLQINDQDEPSNFVFDTGASSTVIDKTYASEMGLKPDFEQAATGAAGSEIYQVCLRQKLKCKDQEISPVTFILTDLTRLSNSMDLKLHGITGNDFFQKFTVEISYTDQKIRLFERGTQDIDLSDYKPLKFENFGGSPIPMIDATTQLNNGTEVSGKVLFDTGAGLSLLINTPFAKQNDILEKSGDHYQLQAGSLTTQSFYDVVKAKSVSVGGHQFEDLEIQISNSKRGVTSQDGIMGIIGNDILRRFDMFVDYSQQTFYLRPNSTYSDEFEFNMSGIQLTKENGELTIKNVVPGSQADQAGLKTNDTILSVDGKKSTDLAQVQQRLRRKGENATLVVRSGNEERTVEIPLKRILN